MITYLSRQLRVLAPLFRPPFNGLWLLVLFYYFWCFLVHPQGQILRGNFPDPDDYMYLDQVLDWLKGQGWYDNVQHRLDPPSGGLIHFSRLPQIPMAAITWFFEFFGLPPNGAATLMAIIWPLCLLGFFFAALRWAAQNFMAKEWAGVTAYVALFAGGTMSMFTPGHVDHHGLILVLMAVTLGCAARMLKQPHEPRWALGAGLTLALALTVALEVLPWIIVISACLGLWAIIEGRAAARSGLVFGLALYMASVGFLLVTRRPAELIVPNVMAFSVVYVFFTGSIAAVFAGVALAARKGASWRWLLGGSIGLVTGAVFLCNFPALTGGPWGGVDPALARLILENVTEALPFHQVEGGWFKTLAVGVIGPLIALGASIHCLRQTRPVERWPWILLLSLQMSALLLTLFYQYRFIGNLGLYSSVAMGALLQRGWKWIGTHERGRRKVWAEIGLLLLVGPLPAVLIPAVADGRSFNTGVLLFPVHSTPRVTCDMFELEKVLRSPEFYGGKPRIIMNTMGTGPELMFRTPHFVVSAPYHEDVAGNLDAVRFFSTTDPARAEAIARRHHVDLVVSCILIPGMYTDLAKIAEVLPDITSSGGHAAAKKAAKAPQPPFILTLVSGEKVPAWLKRVPAPALHNFVVYEVRPLARAGKIRTSE